MNKKISEIRVDETFEGFYLVKAVECKLTNGNKKYLDMILSDQSGEINAKLWDCTCEDENCYGNNSLVKVRGVVNLWQNKIQVKIEKVRLVKPEDGVNAEDLVIAAPHNPEQMLLCVIKYIEAIEDKDIRLIVCEIIEESKEKLLYYPAAMKNHHSIRSGLLYHITSMLKIGAALCEIYSWVNKDYLFAGIILHDIAKLDELFASELGLVIDYTIEGQLLGHIVQGVNKVESVANKIGANQEVKTILQHMILAHHYEPEYGSPKQPMIPEAELLHYIDMIDARMYEMNKALNGLNEKQFSEKIWTLNNRRLYKTTYNIMDEDEKSIS